MLIELNIENLAIIENLRLKFSGGMIALSGDEGSGKSLIVDALGILLGTRAQSKLIRNGKNQATIEAVFSLSENTAKIIKDSLQDIDIEPESDGTLVVTRDLHQQGRSVSRINGRAVPNSAIRKIGQHLVDIHGQLDYISILDIHQQLNLLDSFSDLISLRNSFANLMDKYRQKKRELSIVETCKNQGRLELLKFQISEIEKADVKPGEEEDLQKKLDLLQNSGSVKENCLKIYSHLYEDDRSATVLISEALSLLKVLCSNVPQFTNYNNELNQYMSSLQDMAQEFHDFSEKIDLDVNELNDIEMRLNIINTLKRKYGGTIESIIKYYEKACEEVTQIEGAIQCKDKLESEINRIEREAAVLANQLSQSRLQHAEGLSSLVNQELADVGLPMAKFNISVFQEEDVDGLLMPSGRTLNATRTGIDRIEYMISTNAGESMRPLRTIVSGGETSRIMLALKSALKKVDPIPTLVFDEIDAGIGGRNGDNVGKKLFSLSRQHQVLCITHLPQIACFADSHIKIAKNIKSGRVSTDFENIEGQNRIEEIAAMLGANIAGKTMLTGAEKLLFNASSWKNKEKKECASLV